MRHLAISVWLLALLVAPAQAWLHHGTGAAAPCTTYTGDLANDGCQTSPGGTIQNTSFFTTARQSSQGQYKNSSAVASNHPVNYNVAGVDYPNGAISADGSLTDIKSVSFSGCSGYDAPSNTWVCHSTKAVANVSISGNTLTVNSVTSGTIANGQSLNFYCDPNLNSYCGTHPTVTGSGTTWTTTGPPITITSQAVNFVVNPTLTGVRINDVLYNDDGVGNFNLVNANVTTGLNTCRNKGNAQLTAGYGDLTMNSVTWDFDPICSPIAFLYKQTGDPGLPQEGSGTMYITNGVMTIASYSGTFAVGMVINYPGQSGALMAWTTNDSNFYNCQNSACNTHTANITTAPCGEFVPTCALDSGLTVAGPIAFTVGPIQPNTGLNASGASGWATVTIHYNNMQGMVDILKTSTAGNIDYRWNSCDQTFFPDVHGECISNQPYAAATTTRDHFNYSYSTGVTEKLAWGGSGTGFGAYFSIGGSSPAQLTTTNVNIDHNILVANTSINPSGLTVGYNAYILSQTASFNGIITNLNISSDGFDATGANAACFTDPAVTVTNDNSALDWLLTTGASHAC